MNPRLSLSVCNPLVILHDADFNALDSTLMLSRWGLKSESKAKADIKVVNLVDITSYEVICNSALA